MEIITSRDLAENRGWPRRRPAAPLVPTTTELDCTTCAAPRSACDGCLMSVLLTIDAGGPGSLAAAPQAPASASLAEAQLTFTGQMQCLTPDERRAVEALSRGGLLPPLRHEAVG